MGDGILQWNERNLVRLIVYMYIYNMCIQQLQGTGSLHTYVFFIETLYTHAYTIAFLFIRSRDCHTHQPLASSNVQLLHTHLTQIFIKLCFISVARQWIRTYKKIAHMISRGSRLYHILSNVCPHFAHVLATDCIAHGRRDVSRQGKKLLGIEREH